MSARAKRPAEDELPFPREAVVLITSGTDGVRDSGTGFCIRRDGKENRSFVVTCGHVVENLVDGSGECRVNGRRASIDRDGAGLGMDLAVLVVPDLEVPVLQLRERDSNAGGTAVHGLGYMQLNGGQYVTVDFRGTIDGGITLRRQLASRSVPGFRLKTNAGLSRLVPGNSGSPICDGEGKAVGVLAFASREGTEGYALSSRAVFELYPAATLLPQPGAPKSGAMAAALAVEGIADRPPPPPLVKVIHVDDLQKGRFGGSPTSGPVTLGVELVGTPRTNSFEFDARVVSTKPTIELVGPARFFLHDTFPRSLIEIRRRDKDGSLVLRGVNAYGMFTLGCQVYCSDGQWRQVEFDLLPWGKRAGLSKKLLGR